MYPGTHAATHPDKIAVTLADGGEALTYAELEDRSRRLARALQERGVQRGDCIALLSENSTRYFEVYWAAMRSGFYFTALNTHLGVAEHEHIIEDSGVKALLVSGQYAEMGATLAKHTDVPVRISVGAQLDGFEDLDAVQAATSDAPLENQPAGQDMLYSSGTTGKPKGIRTPLPDRQVDEPGNPLIVTFAPRYGFSEETVYLSPAPLYHAAPLRFCAMIQSLGGTVVVLPKFDAEGALRAIEEHRATHSQWVPTMFVRMLKLPAEVREKYDVSSMRVAVHAAAPCPIEVKQQMIDWWGPVLEEYYAATEVHGITLIDSHEWVQRPGTVGKAALGVLRVCDPDAEGQPEVPTGVDGLVYFERDAMPFEYHNDPVKTREAQHPLHPTWTTTGDVGHVDEDGYLYLTDRRSFMIISGGANIYPQEAENVLTMHPAVQDVAVIGVPDPEMGERVKAVVQPAPGVVGSPELERELIDYVRERIAHYKAPRSVDFLSELPRTPTGKLIKGTLKKQYAQG
ncbi:acyl-CoA synthetase [Nocardioides campestrisoli]|uniref:acyl-CoA synthetase n=1 Tax=Nocardioides campestrisoli TaxID=2736757 RepID=UPI00163DCF3E|nr:acyl-CoA synthetase [Nocardioides campestrisoli]